MDADVNQEIDSVLFVGEGDFSFSFNYISLNQKNKIKENVYATCLCLGSLTKKQQANIDKILNQGGLVFSNVDATELDLHSKLKDLKFKKIVFNFPHVPGKMNIKKNRDLVQRFLISAEKLLSTHGTIWVTLCQGQGGTEIEKCVRKNCDTWQIVSLAAHASLVLSCLKPFDAEKFESYNCTGFRGQEKAFNTKGAMIHVFKHAKPLDDLLENYDYKYSVNFESLSEVVQKLQMRIDKESSPYLKIQSELLKLFKLPGTNQVVMTDLLVCQNVAKFNLFSPLPSHYSNIDICDICLRSLFPPFLNNKADVISVAHNVCCTKNIALNFRPLSHILSYFCCKAETIFTNVCKLLEFLNSASFFPCKQHKPVDISAASNNIQLIEKALKNIDLNIFEEDARNILNIHATYEIHKEDSFLHYSNLEFILSSDISHPLQSHSMKVGNVILMHYESSPIFCLLLDLDNLASLKYHVMDHRILVLKDSFYESQSICGILQDIYRPFSIFPPIYVHDISFYVEEDFSESDFIIVVLDILKYLIKSVSLIDTYYDDAVKKVSRCYRFQYQSYTQPLTKDKASTIHSQIVRKSLQKSLNISLR